MDRLVSKLLIYSNIDEESILMQLASVCKQVKDLKTQDIFTDKQIEEKKDDLITKIYSQMRKLLEVSTSYGFDNNLWHNYIVFLMITDENPFSITCENQGATKGSVNHFAKGDFDIFIKLFDYDFSYIEDALGIDCFSHISNYKAITKPELMYNKNVSEKVRKLSAMIEESDKSKEVIFNIITGLLF